MAVRMGASGVRSACASIARNSSSAGPPRTRDRPPAAARTRSRCVGEERDLSCCSIEGDALHEIRIRTSEHRLFEEMMGIDQAARESVAEREILITTTPAPRRFFGHDRLAKEGGGRRRAARVQSELVDGVP